jgi:hypothetical protein
MYGVRQAAEVAPPFLSLHQPVRDEFPVKAHLLLKITLHWSTHMELTMPNQYEFVGILRQRDRSRASLNAQLQIANRANEFVQIPQLLHREGKSEPALAFP